jgi:PhnB protein
MAAQINPYLCFNGNCEEAFAYYKSIFGGEYLGVNRYKDAPSEPGAAAVEDKFKNLIMNMSLPINKNNILYGSDGHPNYPKVPFGKNVTLMIEGESKEDADRFFKMLSEGGTVSMPIGDMFWGAYFGMCEDKFGMNWMISYTKK